MNRHFKLFWPPGGCPPNPPSGEPLCQPLCLPRGQRVSLWRRRRARKLAPLGRPQAAASAGQPPSPPLPVDQKDRHRQAACGSAAERPRRQPEHNSTAACASAERHASKSTAAQRRVLPAGAATPGRAQQRGGVCFCRAPPRQPERNSTAACASAERCSGAQQHGGARFCRAPPRQPGHDITAACASAERHHASQSTTARRRALLQGAAVARAQQHGGARFCRAPPRQPGHDSTAGVRFCRAPPRQPEHNNTAACGGVRFYRAPR